MKKKNAPAKIPERKKRFLFQILSFSGIAAVTVMIHLYISGCRKMEPAQASPASDGCPSSIALVRASAQELTRKLYLADVPGESSRFSTLKPRLAAKIREWQTKSSVRSASVYLRNLSDASWMSIDGDQQYWPGSLVKVPVMITWLREEQDHPGVLNQEVLFEKPGGGLPPQVYTGESIRPGKKYKVSDLLRYMIVESDNNATYLLLSRLEKDSFGRVFTELGIPPENLDNLAYSISPREYSKFFRVLYNSTYLNRRMSEYALELLAQCRFNEGLTQKLPAGVTVAHKFGERGVDETMDFSEAAIVYASPDPYLLVVMTRGANAKEQAGLISELSAMIYEDLLPADWINKRP